MTKLKQISRRKRKEIARRQKVQQQQQSLKQIRAKWIPAIKKGMLVSAAGAVANSIVSAVMHPLVAALAAKVTEIVHVSHFVSLVPSPVLTRETAESVSYLSQGISDLTNRESSYLGAVEGAIESFEYWDDFAVAFGFWLDHLEQAPFRTNERASEVLVAILERVSLHATLERELPARSKLPIKRPFKI